MALTSEQVTASFAKKFATQAEFDAWLDLIDKFFGSQVALAGARTARSQAATASQQAEATAQAAEKMASGAQAEFDALAAALAG